MFTKSWYLLNGGLLNRGLGVYQNKYFPLLLPNYYDESKNADLNILPPHPQLPIGSRFYHVIANLAGKAERESSQNEI